jgi:hypothetical protein
LGLSTGVVSLECWGLGPLEAVVSGPRIGLFDCFPW